MGKMQHFEGKHYAILGSMLVGLALQIAGLDHWEDAVHPPFVAGALTTLGTTIGSMFVERPRAARGHTRRGDRKKWTVKNPKSPKTPHNSTGE